MSKILKKLEGGGLRSIGKADEVVQDLLNFPELFGEVFEGMLHDSPIIRMRSADVIEKVSQKHPQWIQPYKSRLINNISKIEQQEVRWHLCQLFSYIEITKEERDQIIKILLKFIEVEKSKIVKTFAMQTLADFAIKDNTLKSQIIPIIEELTETGSGAMKSRGRKLLSQLKK